MADPSQDEILTNLLPVIADAQERRRVALDHLRKILALAKHLTAALDVPTNTSDTTRLLLVAGDSMATISTAQIQPEGRLNIVGHAPDDGGCYGGARQWTHGRKRNWATA